MAKNAYLETTEGSTSVTDIKTKSHFEFMRAHNAKLNESPLYDRKIKVRRRSKKSPGINFDMEEMYELCQITKSEKEKFRGSREGQTYM